MNRLERYAAKQEILDLLNSRARGADRYDPALMKACHPLDGTDNHGTYQGPMHSFIDTLEAARLRGPECFSKQHIIGNALFDFRADGDIFVESYHVAHETFAEPDGGTIFFHIGGRYLDTFRKIGGRWLIQHRDIVYDWSRVMPGTRPFWNPETQPAHLMGSRTADDPLYAPGRATRGALIPTRTVKEPTDMDAALQQLLDKQDIAEVLYRRARAGDRSDAELAHGCYHPGATERHGEFDGLAAEFIDIVSFTRPKPGSPIRGMMHMITNILCEFSDADHAFVESYHVAWCQMTDGTDAEIGGRYLDRFERQDGRWAIVHRDVIFDWSRMEPETAKFWERHPAKPFLFGKRGVEDPLYTYIERAA
jgi:ketosteroid isomerase-like protein